LSFLSTPRALSSPQEFVNPPIDWLSWASTFRRFFVFAPWGYFFLGILDFPFLSCLPFPSPFVFFFFLFQILPVGGPFVSNFSFLPSRRVSYIEERGVILFISFVRDTKNTGIAVCHVVPPSCVPLFGSHFPCNPGIPLDVSFPRVRLSFPPLITPTAYFPSSLPSPLTF